MDPTLPNFVECTPPYFNYRLTYRLTYRVNYTARDPVTLPFEPSAQNQLLEENNSF